MRCLRLLACVLLLATAIPILSATGLGGWTRMKDLNDPYVQGIAKFAISQYNKRSKASLTFVSVKSGDSQVVKGVNYRLIISATDGATTLDYDAIV
ncbi:hypothetical protein CDL15_Pgr009553 [Punica granatum]|uniref:Cystatin domain-containing protein n=1 Tax=Punica granatum TaxID=22663 RepID=A0A218WTT0_PUNGR|nr:hypothetical protein CDL15_Pgr009553 [Punica granatum]PKI44451.1 hypothetical protein CRG98_035183 [Punica granatum]